MSAAIDQKPLPHTEDAPHTRSVSLSPNPSSDSSNTQALKSSSSNSTPTSLNTYVRSAPATAFTLFPLLPTELRIKVLTFASLPPISPPKIHLLTLHPLHSSSYISNQAPSPLLHTTSLTRSVYLLTTLSLPIFGTYTAPSMDTIYFPSFTHLSTLSLTRLTTLLDCEDMKHVTRFAVKRELFDRAHRVILDGMVGLQELCVVWRDWRPVSEAWAMREVAFREVELEMVMGRGEAYTEYILKMCRQKYSEGGSLEKKAPRYHERGPVRIRLGLVE